MEQRPLRLGDVIDDYCPRERRVTNHAIVAIVEDVVRQTRCTTCEVEHPYKSGKEPRLRKKTPGDALYDRVLDDVAGGAQRAADGAVRANGSGESAGDGPSQSAAAPDGSDSADAAEANGNGSGDERWNDGQLAHRQLIRATLPRTENDVPTPRPIPEFTMHQRPARGGRGFRSGGGGHANGNGNGNGNVQGRGGFGMERPGKNAGKRHRGNRRPPPR